MTSSGSSIHVVRNSNPAFDDIHSIVLALAGVATALTLRAGESTAFNPGDYLSFGARAVGGSVRLPLWGPIEAALSRQTVDRMELTVDTVPATTAFPRQVTGLGEFFDSLVQPRLVSYFQREKERLMRAAAQDRTNWPPSWQMAWAVRNAVSHAGKSFEKATQKPVAWRGVTFGPSDEPVRSLLTMLNGGDLVLLMIDMANDLP